MAQKEMMLRLLKKNPDSPSGFEIEGWMLIKNGVIYYQPRCDLFQRVQSFRDTTKLDYDSVELGFKVGDEDWFEGDKFDRGGGDIFELIYDRERLLWGELYDDGDKIIVEDGILDIPYILKRCKLIGNIHEEEKQ